MSQERFFRALPSMLLLTTSGAALAQDPAAKDFISDAHAHAKFVAYHPDAMPLLQAAGVDTDLEGVCVRLRIQPRSRALPAATAMAPTFQTTFPPEPVSGPHASRTVRSVPGT